MKKTLICTLFAAAFAFLSCGSTPAETAPAPAPIATPAPDPTPAPAPVYSNPNLDLTGARQITVAKGDTLSDLARRYYGGLAEVGDAGPHNGFYFPVITMASGVEISDPDVIATGMTVVVIDLKKNLDNPNNRQAIKNYLNQAASVYSKKGQKVTEDGLKKLVNSL